jgi:radical SAM protein with 4Fe4S-binding SPASM domain
MPDNLPDTPLDNPAAANKADPPSSITLHLTEACNLRCKMCYYWGKTGRYVDSESGKKPAVLDIGVARKLIEELEPAKPFYSLFGGEPLMYPHLEELIRAVKSAGSSMDTPTNGTLLARHAAMLVDTGFDSVRVSIDGPREISNSQRGPGSYEKAMAGIDALHDAKQKAGAEAPVISIIYTVTPENHTSIEQFFLRDLDLSKIGWVTIQMVNFLTPEMGEPYARMLESEFGITSDGFWKGMVSDTDDFAKMDAAEIARQVDSVREALQEMGKGVLLLPPTFSEENISAYLAAKWDEMSDLYSGCPVPWNDVDIMATGEVAPCHVFYDLVTGNLHEQSFEEIWNGEKYRKFRARMRSHGLMSICPGCCILYLAGSS